MTRGVRRISATPSAGLPAATAPAVGAASPAAAFGGGTFGCRIAPGTVFTWNTHCTNSKAATTYNVGFAVLNTSGSGYTYSWNLSGSYTSIIVGCNSSSYDCAVSVPGRGYHEVSATVTYTRNGQSGTQSAYATVNP